MSLRSGWLGVAAGLMVVAAARAPAQASAQDESTPIARAERMLEQGDFDGALKAYVEAARAPDAAPETQQRYLLVRRTVQLRQTLAAELDADKWWTTAETLRNSYYSLRLYGELLTVSRQMHERKPTPGTASFVADALLQLDRNQEAEQVLSAFEKEKLSTQGRLLLGLALGRQKKTEPAQAMLDSLKLPEDAAPRLLCDVARLKVLCGDVDGGLATLTTAIQKTSPKAVASFRTFVRGAPEFAALRDSEVFAKVLATAPLAGESACSAGPDCGKCPKAADCDTAGAKDKKVN